MTSIRALEATPAFAAHLKAAGLGRADVAAQHRRLETLAALRAADPETFSSLVPPVATAETADPHWGVLAADYLLSAPALAAGGAVAAALWPTGSAGRGWGILMLLAAVVAATRTLQCRGVLPVGWSARRTSLVFEDEASGGRPAATAVALAAAIDAAYGAASLGLGVLAGAGLRARNSQTPGEAVADRERCSPAHG